MDNFRSDQDVLYDNNADLHGIGNRSFIYCSIMAYYIVITLIFLGYRGL